MIKGISNFNPAARTNPFCPSDNEADPNTRCVIY